MPEWWASHLARAAGVPYIDLAAGHAAAAGDASAAAGGRRLAYALLERRNLSGAALLHATSEQEADAIRALDLGVPHRRRAERRRSRRGATRAARGYRARLGIPADAFVVLFLGRMHRIKRLDLLADAFAEVRRDASRRAPGAGRPGRARADPAICCARLVPRRVSRARRSARSHGADKWALLNDADVMVQCSDSESFGLAVVESLAAGVPVVATRTCPWSELETRGCGLWVEQTAPAIAAAIADAGRRSGAPRAPWASAGRRVRARSATVGRDRRRAWPNSTRASDSVSAPFIVLTPNLCGPDGISRLARLVTGTFDEATVLALHEPPSVTRVGRAARPRRRRPRVAVRRRRAARAPRRPIGGPP